MKPALLLVFSAPLLLVACLQEGATEGQRFACVEDTDCAEGFRCAPQAGVDYGACVPLDGASDTTTSDATPTDATPRPGSCSNREQDGDETDVDCGGPECAPCPAVARCLEDRDCVTDTCREEGRCDYADPCAEVSCPDDSSCVNLNRDQTRCVCNLSFVGDGASGCQDIDACQSGLASCVDTCTDLEDGGWSCGDCDLGLVSRETGCELPRSCAELRDAGVATSGVYELAGPEGDAYPAFCDMRTDSGGWTLIARFSNADDPDWIASEALWLDRTNTLGEDDDPAVNGDMLNPAFFQVPGHSLRITRSDDPDHASLLRTTVSCLRGETFRAHLTSLQDNRDEPWPERGALGLCPGQLSAERDDTGGFERDTCVDDFGGPGSLALFARDDASTTASVIMVGGGGEGCDGAAHGVAITSESDRAFDNDCDVCADFGSQLPGQVNSRPQGYSLNLWVR